MRALWTWLKVILCLVAIELLLFHAGLFWRVTPNFGGDVLNATTWSQVYIVAREFETKAALPNGVFLVGDSIMWTGIDEALVHATLQRAHVPATVLSVSAFGTAATDAAILTWAGRRLDPWLVIYGLQSHNFMKPNTFITTDTPIKRVLYDASLDLPPFPRTDAEAILDGWVKRQWKLYRYRFFARKLLITAWRQGWETVRARVAWAQAPRPLPPEARQFFDPFRVTPESYAVWERWRRSRRFSDYADWLRAGPIGAPLLDFYDKMARIGDYSPQDNAHVGSLEWMLGFLQNRGTRVVLVYLPENPVFRDPEAKAYFNLELSDTYAVLLAREAAQHGGRFVDLRNFLPAEDFMDLRHPNLEGKRQLSARMATIIAEEWRARQQQSGAVHAR